MGATGSENTGQASGAAALISSYGREVFGENDPLSGNEIRQLLTMTAEDVRPLNTGLIGLPDKAQTGWDPHFGYGRVNLAGAMARVKAQRIPPEAQLDSPDWFTPVNVDRLRGRASRSAATSRHRTRRWASATGRSITRAAPMRPIPRSSRSRARRLGARGRLARNDAEGNLDDLADTATALSASILDVPWRISDGNCPGRPLSRARIRSGTSSRSGSPSRRKGNPNNIGRYRKALFAYRDDGNLADGRGPWSDSNASQSVTGSGGEVPPRLFDLNGDNALDVIQATSQASSSSSTPPVIRCPASTAGSP